MGTSNCAQSGVEQVSRSNPRPRLRGCMGQMWALFRRSRNPIGEMWYMLPGSAVSRMYRHKTMMKLWWGATYGGTVSGMMTQPVSNTWRRERFRVTHWPQVCTSEGDNGGGEWSVLPCLAFFWPGYCPWWSEYGPDLGVTAHNHHPNVQLGETQTASHGEREKDSNRRRS